MLAPKIGFSPHQFTTLKFWKDLLETQYITKNLYLFILTQNSLTIKKILSMESITAYFFVRGTFNIFLSSGVVVVSCCSVQKELILPDWNGFSLGLTKYFRSSKEVRLAGLLVGSTLNRVRSGHGKLKAPWIRTVCAWCWTKQRDGLRLYFVRLLPCSCVRCRVSVFSRDKASSVATIHA